MRLPCVLNDAVLPVDLWALPCDLHNLADRNPSSASIQPWSGMPGAVDISDHFVFNSSSSSSFSNLIRSASHCTTADANLLTALFDDGFEMWKASSDDLCDSPPRNRSPMPTTMGLMIGSTPRVLFPLFASFTGKSSKSTSFSKDSSVMWLLSTKNPFFSLALSRWSIQISFLQCSWYLGSCLTCPWSSLLASNAFFFLFTAATATSLESILFENSWWVTA
jgi:hypothetical protein